MKFLAFALALSAAVSATASPLQARAPIAQPRTIVYEVGPCHGFCPVYRISVSASGRGVFTGIRNTTVTGKRRFRATSSQYRRFAASLAAYRPRGERVLEDQTQCPSFATDMSTVDVYWLSSRRTSHLRYNFGCDRATNADLAGALRAAPDFLPLAAMVGGR